MNPAMEYSLKERLPPLLIARIKVARQNNVRKRMPKPMMRAPGAFLTIAKMVRTVESIATVIIATTKAMPPAFVLTNERIGGKKQRILMIRVLHPLFPNKLLAKALKEKQAIDVSTIIASPNRTTVIGFVEN